jgi:hypothetical protein
VAAFSPLLDVLAEVPDPRRAEGKLYGLPYVLLFSICAAVLYPRHRDGMQLVSRHRHLHRR